jgi:hypothetical protein
MSASPQQDQLPFDALIRESFDRLPRGARNRCFGVDYARLDLPTGGQLLLTQHGWRFAECLLPRQWYDDRHYVRAGTRLPGGTGAVYRVPTRPVGGRSIDIVVKFSRVGQEVPLEMATSFPDEVTDEDIAAARFNSPFEEFGLLEEMRRGAFGPRDVRIRTHRPLAIYIPDKQYDLWKLGRSHSRFTPHQRSLKQDQSRVDEPLAIELDIKRDYVLVYSWIKGDNAEDCFLRGALSEDELLALSPRVHADLAVKGFRVLDNKPKHYILRLSRRHGKPIARGGSRPTYALVDFELLQRTGASQRSYQLARRVQYWALQAHMKDGEPHTSPPQLHKVNILGVDYIYSVAPNGGRLWVVGNDPDLFDFFMPDRWRRTPRLKLSSINEVYRTRTRDNVYLVYRRSRVGEKPHVEPAYEYGRAILDYGFNAPFEVVAIAKAMRDAGIPTVYPRAIYRTAHESKIANYLADRRRYEKLRDIRVPDAPDESVLEPDHDYYTIWGLWRGVDPMAAQDLVRPVIDLQQARDEGLIGQERFEHLCYTASRGLASRGVTDEIIDETRLLVSVEPDGTLRQAHGGEVELTIAIDAQRAFEHELMARDEYRALLDDHTARLRSVGFDPLDLHGDHILLTAGLDGILHRDAAGELMVTHCNFDLVRRMD